ncbi:hypothetical protein DNU06_04870 [Putridiphycobacter roseus]|uniref:histidine kinase n=1 Tax=Putridiphycobacter roseus TaxID=2219161 RepID=A0A2W1NFT7_9FLAO|nr:PAS domain S-box protein [Putridiphycobacter roseus]PZE17953.1 hypothetical protein DNU06_04870 [Putridiphycobacter roseus]
MDPEKLIFTISILFLITLIILLLIRLNVVNKRLKNKSFAYQRIQAEKIQFEKLLDSVNDIIYIADDKGLFTYYNHYATLLLGYTKEENIGRRFQELIHKDHVAHVQKSYYNHFAQNLKQSYLEFQIKKKDGNIIWVGQQVTSKFSADDPTKIIGFYGVVRDINDRKLAELLLSESEIKYRELFDNSSELIHSIDTDGEVLYANNSWLQKLGYTESELKDLNYFSVIHPDSHAHCTEFLETVIEKGKFEGITVYNLQTKAGQKITVEGSVTITQQNGKVYSIQSFLRDITKQKEAEIRLTKQENTLRQITETINDVFYLYNMQDKKYEYISANCESILGANKDFFYTHQRYPKLFVHELDEKKLLAAHKIVESGIPYSIDYRITVNEETKWINEKSFPILDDAGKVVANSGICRDITDLKQAQNIIHDQNIEIGLSIQYAKSIQEAVLPSEKRVASFIADAFVLFKPKAIVSGDFFVVDKINTNEGNELLTLIVGDCTGHGVPGAVLSLMCNVLVRESFTRVEVNTPAEALDFIRKRLIAFLGSQQEKIIQDGMDIAFSVLDQVNSKLYFAGANISCIIVRGNEAIEHKGNRQHIGYMDNPKPFSNHVIDIEKGDCIFLYTDGFMDQFGGEKNKKYSKKRLHQFLIKKSHLSMAEINKLLEEEFMIWKGDFEQIDDVTIMGFRFN